MNQYIPILLYHDIESKSFPNEKLNIATRDTVVSLSDFQEQMEYLSRNGYKTLTLAQLFHLYENKKYIDDKSIVLTFDDGHYSNYNLALPVLRQYDFTAVFFIIADRIDTEYHLSGSQIKEMLEQGMEIGSHGLSHQYLPLLDDISIAKELHESKTILEKLTKQNIDFFCFPGGHYDQSSLKLLKTAGYKGCCSCVVGMNTIKTNPFLLRRIEVRRKCSIKDFAKNFSFIHLWFYYYIDQFKGIVKRIVGLNNYSKIRNRFYKYYFFRR